MGAARVNDNSHGAVTQIISHHAEVPVRLYLAKRPVERPSGLPQPALQHAKRKLRPPAACHSIIHSSPSAEKHSKCQIGERSGLDLGSLSLPQSAIAESVFFDLATVDVGDLFEFHLHFGGQALHITDISGASDEYMGWQFISTPPSLTGFLFNTTFQFEGVQGQLLTNDFNIGFGGPIGAFLPNWNLTDSEFSFTGISLLFDITFKESGRPAFTTQQMDFHAFFDPGDGQISAVPIPAAAWLFASALGVFGYLGKRKANA